MANDPLAPEERLVLIQIRWGLSAPTGFDDEKICRRLEAKGLITKIARGGWALTSSGRLKTTPEA